MTRSSAGRLELLSWAGAILLLLCLPGSSRAEDRAAVAQMQIEALAAEGRCEEALALIPDPALSAGMLAVRGQCEIQQGRYEAAVESLQRAQELDPSQRDLDLYLGIARYHLGDNQGARAALERSQGATAQEGQQELYTGLLQLEEKEYREAALSLERARQADPSGVEPTASYYAGVAWQAAGERELARESFERVREVDPDGVWGAQAERALALRRPRRGSWARVRAGLEYDTNVLLADDSNLPTDEDDGRGVWTAEGGVEVFRSADWSGGVLATYRGERHFFLDEFDTHYPEGAVWIDREFSAQTLARVRYDVGYAWVGYEPYLFDQAVSGLFWHDWGTFGSTEVGGRFYSSDYRFELDRKLRAAPMIRKSPINRAGLGWGVDFEQRVPLRVAQSAIRVGYAFDQYESIGTEWDGDSHRLLLGLDGRLPGEVGFEVFGSYTRGIYDHSSVFEDRDLDGNGILIFDPSQKPRRENFYTTGVELSRRVHRFVELSARYVFSLNDANVDGGAYDYRRHVVGAYVSVDFGGAR